MDVNVVYQNNPGFYELPVWVVSVTDGDTVHVIPEGASEPLKVRLGGIDAPEMNQSYGEESRDLLTALSLGKCLTLDVVCTGSNAGCPGGVVCTCTDRYGRRVGILHDGNWRQSVNKEMVEQGLAYNWPKYGMLYGGNNAQIRARKKRVGIWARFGGDVRPWSHRHGGALTPMEYMKAEAEARAEAKANDEKSRPEEQSR